MDVFKFIILSVACISGFMVSSYQGIAQQRGWPVGTMFNLDRMGYVAILGFMCQWGSVIISFFVNPWWSAFLVLIVGFVGNMILTSIFKSFTQIIALPLLIGSFILISLYAFSSTSPLQSVTSYGNQNLENFTNSIDYANQATELMNRLPPFEQVDKEEMEKVINLKRKALNEATLVEIEKLNNKIPGFDEHYKSEYILGLKYFIEGYSDNDNSKIVESYRLLHRWGLWYEDNYEKF